MDSTLSEFIAHTGADPGLAQDILEGQQWDLSKSLQAYYFLRGITAASAVPNFTTMPMSFSSGDGGHSTVILKEDAFPPARSTLNHKQYHQPDGPKFALLTNTSPSKPVLQKEDSIDLDDAGKKLTRGISRATDNVNLVSKARSEFARDFRDSPSSDYFLDFIIETPVYTFTLPDLTIYQEDFVAFLEKDLIETSTLVSLEQAGRLNWWTAYGTCQRLWPLATTGDGNCLLHAASLGMWGFHDRLLTLRKALHATLTKGPYRHALWRRWRWQQTLQNQEAGLVYSEEEWQMEWNSLLRLSSTEPRSGPGRRLISHCDSSVLKTARDTVKDSQTNSSSGGHDIYESLEEAHVLALAHVLRRPIIVVADTMLKDVTGEPFAPIPFGGVYLPLECLPSQCHRSPLVLTYDAAHFSALVAMDREAYVDKTPLPAAVIPLTDAIHRLLPLQYAVDPGENFAWGVHESNPKVVFSLTQNTDDKLAFLLQYLDVVHVPIALPKQLTEHLPLINGSLDVDANIQKKSTGGSFESDDSSSPSSTEASSTTSSGGLLSGVSKHRATKQIQTVARQFGSIGRSMSKRIKKNLGNFKLGRSNSFKEGTSSSSKNENNNEELPTTPTQQRHTLPSSTMHRSTVNSESTISKSQDFILAAKLNAERRHEYQEEMLKNYLHSARLRFERITCKQNGDEKILTIGMQQCVNTGCSGLAKAANDYLCTDCYENKPCHSGIDGLAENANGTLYGIGKSRFYAGSSEVVGNTASDGFSDPDSGSIILDRLLRKPALINQDQTLYLSNSTFYNDVNTPPMPVCVNDRDINLKGGKPRTIDEVKPRRPCRSLKCPFFGTAELDFYCSQCHKLNKVSENADIYPNLIDQIRTTQI